MHSCLQKLSTTSVTVTVATRTFIISTAGLLLKSKQPRFTKSVRIELILGSFVVQKSRPAESLAHIHSKSIAYFNNGSGRDTYVSTNDGGFRPSHHSGSHTYFNTLREYPHQNQRSNSNLQFSDYQCPTADY